MMRSGVQEGYMERKMSAVARIWICLCMAASLAMAIVFIVLFSTDSRILGAMTEKQLAWVVVPLFLTCAGYFVLLCGKKAGFYAVLAVAVFSAVCSLAAKMLLPALFSLVNPIVTWLLLRNRWNQWSEIDKRRLAADRQTKKPRRRKTALLLAALPWTGLLGVDRFYLGYIGLGLLKFFTAGGLFVLYVMDIVKIARGTMLDKYGRPLV
jgi:hypothetical protein